MLFFDNCNANILFRFMLTISFFNDRSFPFRGILVKHHFRSIFGILESGINLGGVISECFVNNKFGCCLCGKE
jgi:hypothetical protein